ncbi:cobalamin biosynthesis protein CbiD [Butyrivibrio sp. XB500-5]|uniref:cobalt-precorrin-5B (C(1))-methyltransferase CbiD n=1 Tax=Butyrivibrio sp. XB500-5 TaxID=2364880 RepID=UPI000EA93FD8|nr:cobalt-precorrin-5B (C(1))-methyltransferase CbiD [Butyrivibrio sp. XB500-5]RKM59111.1 cobalamin biosynthesis protein CbiD [Butyrivibrio sp. XB500-5]
MDSNVARNAGLILSPLTTGDCAAAAARAAAACLLFRIDYEFVTIKHQGGNSRTISVYKVEDDCDEKHAHFYAIMEGGAAPDIRERAEIHVDVAKITDFRKVDDSVHVDTRYGNLFIKGGEGIGVAFDGVPGIKRGEALIEKEARNMIFESVANVCETADGAQLLLITVSCPEGMMIAAKQTVGQSAFAGGITIMGECGTVSQVHQRDIVGSIENQIEKQMAMGVNNLIISPGNYCADDVYRNLHVSLNTSIYCFNFPGFAIDAAVNAGIESILLVGNAGKLVKLAAGIMNTNSYASDGRREIFAAHTAIVGGTSSQVRTVMACVTVDEILSLLDTWGLRERVMASIMNEIDRAVENRCHGKLKFGVALFSEAFGLLGTTKNTRNVIIKVSQDQYALSLKLK